jgi:hypothetical protein
MSVIVFVTTSISAVQIVNDVGTPDKPSSRHPRVKCLFNSLMYL